MSAAPEWLRRGCSCAIGTERRPRSAPDSCPAVVISPAPHPRSRVAWSCGILSGSGSPYGPCASKRGIPEQEELRDASSYDLAGGKTMKDWLAYTVAVSAALLAQILIVGLR